MKDDGGSAYPCAEQQTANGDIFQYASSGMTLRDWFAGMALQGLLAASPETKMQSDGTWTFPKLISGMAYEYADAMIEARKK